jgi:hypothetical protein
VYQSIHRKPHWFAAAFLAVMIASVLGLVGWKASAAREVTLSQAKESLDKLAHSLDLHTVNIVKAPDVAMGGMADLLKYQNPSPDRFNAHLAATIRSMQFVRCRKSGKSAY